MRIMVKNGLNVFTYKSPEIVDVRESDDDDLNEIKS